MTYSTAIDFDAIEAIDMHVHYEVDSCGRTSLPQDYLDASAAYFRGGDRTPSADGIAELYRQLNMAAVLFTVDARTQLGHRPNSVDDLVSAATKHNDVLIPFGTVDPRTGNSAVHEAVRQVEELGVWGLKFHPSLQGFDPSDQQYYPLWEAISDLGVPALFHTGQNGIGAGMTGGGGLKLWYSNPLLLDEVAAEFPELTVIMAHPSVPWQDEANAIAIHKPNVFIDLSGWSPKYFPESLVRLASNLLADKLLFGTDYPLISPQKWFGAFTDLPVKDQVRPGILKGNALRVLAV